MPCSICCTQSQAMITKGVRIQMSEQLNVHVTGCPLYRLTFFLSLSLSEELCLLSALGIHLCVLWNENGDPCPLNGA